MDPRATHRITSDNPYMPGHAHSHTHSYNSYMDSYQCNSDPCPSNAQHSTIYNGSYTTYNDRHLAAISEAHGHTHGYTATLANTPATTAVPTIITMAPG
jgi:hypothetical protein